MGNYIIQVFAFQLLFLLVYDLFFQKETFFNWNRVYLLSTIFLSMVIPFIKINSFKGVVPKPLIISLPEVFIGDGRKTTHSNEVSNHVGEITGFNWEFLFCIGAAISVLIFLFKLISIVLRIYKNPKIKFDKVILVELPESRSAFSFFYFIFLGTNLKVKQRETIIKHEMVHVKEWHTLDLLFFEILRVLFWFNPLIYVYQNRVISLHEFIADEGVTKKHDKHDYYQNLLSQIFQTENISFINPFFKQSLIKKRISMLQKSKSKKSLLWKYAIILPLVVGMLIYSACEQENKSINDDLNLSEYSFTMNDGKPITEEMKQSKKKYFSFLENSNEHVGWVLFDHKTGDSKHSIHAVTEKVPEGYKKFDMGGSEGKTPVMYFKMINNPKNLQDRKDFKDAAEVPFGVIDKVPVFPGCEDLTSEEQKTCFSQNISQHVNRNFNVKIAEELNLKGRQRINVIFKINKDGLVEGVRARAPNEELKNEAIRVIKTIPKMIPGEHYENKVGVFYSLPIVFQISD